MKTESARKLKKLVIHQDSIRALATESMKRDDVVEARLTPCLRCGTTR